MQQKTIKIIETTTSTEPTSLIESTILIEITILIETRINSAEAITTLTETTPILTEMTTAMKQ